MPVSNKVGNIEASSKSVVALYVWVLELGDSVFSEVESYFMVDVSYSATDKDARVGV